MRKITFDIETSNMFSDVGSADASLLDLAVVCIHDSKTNKYSSFFQENLNELWPIIEKADMLIGYNSNNFDIPLLNKYYAGDLRHIKSLDLLEEIRKSLGRRIKLDDIAKGTLGEQKSADGLQSLVWWKQGEKQKVVDYCIQDVRVTKKIYDYAILNGYLIYPKNGDFEKINLDTSRWEEKEGGLLPTLGF